MYFNKIILQSNIAQILYCISEFFIPDGQNKLHLVIVRGNTLYHSFSLERRTNIS